MEFRLLGPVEAGVSGVVLPLGGGKQRALLALLLLNADRVVPVEQIVDGLWGDEVPETAVKGVQIYVSRLRKVLPPGRLETKAPGYVLHLEPGELDLERFDGLLATGRDALAARRPADASDALRAALDLWRGPALSEFEEPFAAREAARLEELRLTCLEQRIDADLALGRHGELVGELDSLVSRYPLREGLRAQQLLALYGSGRQAEALATYQEFRTRLDDELGIEPSQRLRDLERRILQQDPELDLRGASPGARIETSSERPAPAAGPADATDRGTLVGRNAELGRLRRLYAESLDCHRQVVFVTGPAGIGKTSLVRSFLAESEAAGALVAHGQCLEQYGAGEAYMPLLEALERLCNSSAEGEFAPLLAERAPTWLEQMPSIRGSRPESPASEHGNSRPRMLRELSSVLESIAAEQPLVLALEDLHWSDPSTIDALNAVARRTDPSRLLLLATYRPQDARALAHPVAHVSEDLEGRELASNVQLGTLSRRAVVDYLGRRFPGNDLPLELAELLHERTDGHPLFLQKVVDSWLADGAIGQTETSWELRGTVAALSVDVPGTVRQLIGSQLDRLAGPDQELIEAASVAGPEFASATVAAACDRSEADVEARLTELAAVGHFVEPLGASVWPDGTVSARFGFLHDLYGEVAYARLPPGRRARVHRAVGVRLAEAYAEHAEEVATELATHFTRGNDAGNAVRYAGLAAEQALRRSAHQEAIEHLTRALSMLDELPAGTDRAVAEVPLRIALGSAYMKARGYAAPEVREAYARARELCLQLGDTAQLVPVLYGLCTVAEVAGEYRAAYELAQELLELSESGGSAEEVAAARIAQGWPLICMGRHAEAREALEQIADDAATRPDHGLAPFVDPGVERLAILAWTLWFQGFPEAAVTRSEAAVELAAPDPFRLVYALTCDSLLRLFCRDHAAAAERGKRALALADDLELPLWQAWASIVHGWAITEDGSGRIETIRAGLEAASATGSSWARTYILSVLAEVCLVERRFDAGLRALDEAFALVDAGDERFALPELLRLRAELRLATGAPAEAEADLAEALDVARSQGARSLELRAAISLARLQRAQGRTGEARVLLSGIFGWFTEGLDTPDLRDAAALLEELGGPVTGSGLDATGPGGTGGRAPIVGRDAELARLAELLHEASRGSRQLVFVSGEAGIGKTSLVEAFLSNAASHAEVLVARGQCIEHRGSGEAYLPVLDALGRLGRTPSVDVKGLLASLAPSWLIQLPSLLEAGDAETLQPLAQGATRERMLREMVDALDELGRTRTLVLLLEDLHWADYSTLDLLEALARRSEPTRLLVVGTHRPPARSEDPHLVGTVAGNLRLRGLASELALEALTEIEVDEYIQVRLSGSDAPASLAARIHELTGGNPLFVEKVVDAWIDDGVVQTVEGRWAFAADLERLTTSVPGSLRQLIEQRLADLDPEEQALLEAASVAGAEFAAAAVAAACEQPDEAVESALRRLASLGTFVEPCGEEVWPDRTVSARFGFTHDLCREVLYDRLPAGRRARLHVLVGGRLYDAYGSRAGEIAPELASHFVRGHDPARAVEQLQLAGAQALQRAAHREAIDHLLAGLELVEELPTGPERDLAELGVRLRLGPALFGVGGWASEDAEDTLVRAQELAEQLGRGDERATALLLLGTMHEVRGDYRRSQLLLESSLALPGPPPSSSVLVDSREILACSLFHQGAFGSALDEAETAIGLWDGGAGYLTAAYGEIAGVSCHTWAALALWFLGRPDAAADRADRAIALARDEHFALARAFAYTQAAMVSQLRGEPAATIEHAERAIEEATAAGYTHRLATGTILRAWARAHADGDDVAVSELSQGLELSRSTGARMDDPYYLGLLADARLASGRPADALSDLSEALSLLRTSRDFFYEPELHRLRGEALLSLDRRGDAEAAFEEAIERARRGGSPSLELRASLSLARLRLADSLTTEAAELVRAPYSTFTEGYDTPDLKGARALLEDVSSPGRGMSEHAPLLERADALVELARALGCARAGTGRLVLVLGEAGIGKTSLVEEFAATRASAARILRGACDPLLTPRALGPILDVAAQAGGALAQTVAADSSREDVFDALRQELGREPGTVVLLEDMHWADEGSLDVLSFLGRRIAQLPCLLVATARDDGSAGAEALRTAVAELPPGAVSRLELTGLSPSAVDELARRAGRSSEGLHALTGGNAFFVTEVLATETGRRLPSTVKDAVAARCRRLSPAAREVLDTVSVVPGRVETALLEAVLGGMPGPGLEECLATGMLEPVGGAFRFRHEIARLAVEESLSPVRRAELERRTLGALVVDEQADLARVVHHARLAGDDETVRRYAPAAASVASAAGAHREALEHYRAALAVVDQTDRAGHAALLEGFAEQAYLCGLAEEALDARREALVIRRALGDPFRVGDNLRWIARILWWLGRREEAEAAGAEAVEALEAEGPSRELAMALSTVSQLYMPARQKDPALDYGARALEVARAVDDVEAIVHASTNVGTVLLMRDQPDEGAAMLEEAFRRADGAGLHESAVRALVNLAAVNVERRDLAAAEPAIERALGYCDAHDLIGFQTWVLGLRAICRLERGDWKEAEADALAALRGLERDVTSICPLYVIGLLRARRGDPQAEGALQEAEELAGRSGDHQWLAPLAAARAELAWLRGDLEGVASAAREAYDRALTLEDPLTAGELAFWLWRAHALDDPPALAGEPYRRSIEGDWRGAADAWKRIGAPYLQAEALSHANEEGALREALELYERLGARVPAGRLRRQLDAMPATRNLARRTPIRYARSGDLNVAFQVTGAGPVDLVLVPGFVSHLDKDWEEPRHAHFLDRLSSFSRLIRFDKRGTGLSDRPGDVPDLETRMDDLRAVMDAAGSARAVLFGYSEGGALSILFTATYPERVAALVLYGVFAKRVDPDDDYPWAATQEARSAYIEQLVDDWGYEANMQEMCPSADEAMARWWGERCRAAASPGAIRALMRMNSLVDVRSILPSIHVPTLVVHRAGDVDTAVEEGRYVASRIRGAESVELPGRDHFVAIEPDQILDVVEPFVREVQGGVTTEADRVLATVLMTDIVGSTETLSRVGDSAWSDLLARHNEALQSELERFSGELIESTGDGIVALFDGPSRAIRCGEAIHARLAALGLAVRVGLHTGEIERRQEGPRGIAVHLAARVMAEAGPGEVLVTATTRDLVSGSGLAFTDRGERLLKGIDEPRRLYAVVVRA